MLTEWWDTQKERIHLHGLRNLPYAVEIETNSKCTRSCWYCPRDPKRQEALEDKIFLEIIQSLKDVKYKGYIALHGFNEPLTDPDIFEKIKYISEVLPKHILFFILMEILLTKRKFY